MKEAGVRSLRPPCSSRVAFRKTPTSQRGGWELCGAWLGQCSYLEGAVTVGACFTIIIFLSSLHTQGGAGTLDFEIQSQTLPRRGQPHGCLSLRTCQRAPNVERRETLTQTVGSGGRRVSAGSSAAAAAPSGGMLMGGLCGSRGRLREISVLPLHVLGT